MSISFAIISLVTLLSAIAAVSLRNLVHCALSLILTFAGLAALYLNLNAQFVGFAQILVYIGAVAILLVFAILLTRSGENVPAETSSRGSWWIGPGIAVLTCWCLIAAVLHSALAQRTTPPLPTAPVEQIGAKLMREYVLPLEVLGLLLTAAMLGAVIIALRDNKTAGQPSAPPKP